MMEPDGNPVFECRSGECNPPVHGLLNEPVFSPLATVGAHRSPLKPTRPTGCSAGGWGRRKLSHGKQHRSADHSFVSKGRASGFATGTRLSWTRSTMTSGRGAPSPFGQGGHGAACGLPCTSRWLTRRSMKHPGKWGAGHSSSLEDLSGAPVTSVGRALNSDL